MGWNPHITVATLVRQQNRFLLVEEWDEKRPRAPVHQRSFAWTCRLAGIGSVKYAPSLNTTAKLLSKWRRK